MTVIAAYIDRDGCAAIAADSQTRHGYRFTSRASKLQEIGGGWVAGMAGHSLWARFAAEFAEMHGASAPHSVPQAFADAWIEWAAERGHGLNDGGHWRLDSSWLLAGLGGLVIVGCDGSLLRPDEPYAAIGSGAEVALGVLWAARQGREPALAVARSACLAAIQHSPGCGGRVDVWAVRPEGPARVWPAVSEVA